MKTKKPTLCASLQAEITLNGNFKRTYNAKGTTIGNFNGIYVLTRCKLKQWRRDKKLRSPKKNIKISKRKTEDALAYEII